MKLVAKKSHQKTQVFTNIENQVFSKLINWSSGYFDLFLQEDLKDKLIIYCPNGSITIQYFRKTSELKLTVENKRIENCIEYFSRILQLYKNVNEIGKSFSCTIKFKYNINCKKTECIKQKKSDLKLVLIFKFVFDFTF